MNRLRQFVIAAPIAAALLLAGCTATTGDLAAGTATSMQESVKLIAERAAASDIVGALSELDALQARLEQARTAGTIGAERAARVQQRIDLVRADLQTLAAQPTPTTTPEPTDVPDEAPDEAPPGTPAEPSQPAAPTPTPTPTPEPTEEPSPTAEPEPSPEEEITPEPEPSTPPSQDGGEEPDTDGQEGDGDEAG